MRTHGFFSQAFSAILIILGAAAVVPIYSRASTTIITNPGFEAGPNAPAWNTPIVGPTSAPAVTPTGWGTAGTGSFQWVTEGTPGLTTHSSCGAVAISGVNPGSLLSACWSQRAANLTPVQAGEVLQISAWIMGTDTIVGNTWDLQNDGYQFAVTFFDSSNTYLGFWASGGSGLSTLTAVGTWGEYTQSSTPAPTGAAWAKVSLYFARTSAANPLSAPVITFDDVVVTQSFILANPGFETETQSQSGVTPADWGTLNTGNTVLTYITSGTPNTPVHSGSSAVSISNVSAGDLGTACWVQLSNSWETVSPGEAVQVSAWVKGGNNSNNSWQPANDGYQFGVDFMGTNNKLISHWQSGGGSINTLMAANTWYLCSQTSPPAPVGTASARVSLYFGRLSSSTSSNSFITFDDLSVFALNLAYPEPIASWTQDQIAAQEGLQETPTEGAQYVMSVVNGTNSGTSATDPNVISIPEGDYRFDTPQANTFAITGKNNITIQGQGAGAHFWFNPFSGDNQFGISLNQCDHIVINNVTIDYTVTPYCQGKVTAIDTSTGAITFAPDPGFTIPTDAIVDGGKIYFFTTNYGGAFIPTFLDHVSDNSVRANSDGTYTVLPLMGTTMYGNGRPTTSITSTFVGSYVTLAARNLPSAVALNGCTNVTLNGVTVYASPQMGFTDGQNHYANLPSQTGGGNSYINCNVVPRPNTFRILSTNADAFHCTAVATGPTVEGCEFGWPGDDTMNIHGYINVVENSPQEFDIAMITQFVPDLASGCLIDFYNLYDPNGPTKIKYSQPISYPNQDFTVQAQPVPSPSPGTSANNSALATDNIASFIGSAPLATPPVYAPISKFTIESELSVGNITVGTLAMKRSQIDAGSQIIGNYFHDTAGRGIILNSEGTPTANSLIENNTVSNVGTCSILVSPDLGAMEGPYSRNITIEDNTINANGASGLISSNGGNAMIGAITVTGDISYGTIYTASSPGIATPFAAEHQNITIANNTINNPVACGIFVSDVTNGTIYGNAITNPYCTGETPLYANGPVGKTVWGSVSFAPATSSSAAMFTNIANSYFGSGVPPCVAISLADCSNLTLPTTVNRLSKNTVMPTTSTLYGSYGWFTGPAPPSYHQP
jgi:hypothetical protein